MFWPVAASIEFNDIQVGEQLPSYEFQLTTVRVQRYVKEVESSNPWYIEGSPFGGPIAPAMLCDTIAVKLRQWEPIVVSVSAEPGFLHAKQEYEFLAPVRLGKKITVQAMIADKYVKRGRRYVAIEGTSIDEDGTKILRSRSTYCWLAPL